MSLRSQLAAPTLYSRTMAHFGPWVTITMGSSATEILVPELIPRPYKSLTLVSLRSQLVQTHSLFTQGRWLTLGHGLQWQWAARQRNTSSWTNSTPIQVIDSGVTQVAAGGFRSLFLKNDGSLWAMGHNDYGQLGNGNTSSQYSPIEVIDSGVAQVAAGGYHSLSSRTMAHFGPWVTMAMGGSATEIHLANIPP